MNESDLKFSPFYLWITGYDRKYFIVSSCCVNAPLILGTSGLGEQGSACDQLQGHPLHWVLHWGDGLFCFTFLKPFPGQGWFGRKTYFVCWALASHLVLKLELVASCQRLDWEIWMQAGNPSKQSQPNWHSWENLGESQLF